MFFGGMADIFLSLVLWFILDSEKSATVIGTGERIYAVQNVIRLDSSVNNFDCVEEEEEIELPSRN